MPVPADEPRLRRLLDAVPQVVGELELAHVLERIVEAAVELVDARWGALGVLGLDGMLEQFVHVDSAAAMSHSGCGHAPPLPTAPTRCAAASASDTTVASGVDGW